MLGEGKVFWIDIGKGFLGESINLGLRQSCLGFKERGLCLLYRTLICTNTLPLSSSPISLILPLTWPSSSRASPPDFHRAWSPSLTFSSDYIVSRNGLKRSLNTFFWFRKFHVQLEEIGTYVFRALRTFDSSLPSSDLNTACKSSHLQSIDLGVPHSLNWAFLTIVHSQWASSLKFLNMHSINLEMTQILLFAASIYHIPISMSQAVPKGV